MSSTRFRHPLLCALLLGAGSCSTAARGTHAGAATVDLAALARQGSLESSGRQVTVFAEGGREAVRLSEAMGDGIVWIGGLEFDTGTIEIDVRGRDVQGGSFVGLAFDGADVERYEAVYLRPFNFRSADPARRAHAIQYISHPVHTWMQLRNDHPGIYESAIEPAPDPVDWVPMRLVVERATVRAYIGGAREPSLTVTRLENGSGRKVGLWVGNTSGGEFANLRVTPDNAALGAAPSGPIDPRAPRRRPACSVRVVWRCPVPVHRALARIRARIRDRDVGHHLPDRAPAALRGKCRAR